jgi:predicted SprT family Zn-dependent metalloprotease
VHVLSSESVTNHFLDRLLNIVAHEFCHLACMIISDVRENHGKVFKDW